MFGIFGGNSGGQQASGNAGGNSGAAGADAGGQTAPQGGMQTTATPGNTAPAGNSTEQQQPSQSPIDKFAQLWQTGDSGNDSGPKSYVAVDPAKLSEATGKLNFVGGLKQDQVQAIFSGGEGAVQAFNTAINQVAQQVFQTAMLGSGRMMEQALQSSRSDLLSELPAHMRHQLTMDGMQTKYPGISHPAVRPLLEVLQSQLQAKNPGASPAELQTMAAEYITNVGKMLTTEDNMQARLDSQGKAGNTNVDWDNFFNL